MGLSFNEVFSKFFVLVLQVHFLLLTLNKDIIGLGLISAHRVIEDLNLFDFVFDFRLMLLFLFVELFLVSEVGLL